MLEDGLKTERTYNFENCKSLIMLGSGGWIRTSGLRVMSPTSFQAAPPRVIILFIVDIKSFVKLNLGTSPVKGFIASFFLNPRFP